MMLSSVAIILVHRSDIAILRDLTNKTGVSTVTYTLSLKFQLEENVRVTKILVILSVGYSIWALPATILSSLSFLLFDGTHPLIHLFYALFNNYVALSFAILVWSLLSAMGETRRVLEACLASCCCSFKIGDRPAVVSKESARRIDDHFSQLNSAWAPP